MRYLIIAFLLIPGILAKSQVLLNPNYSFKTHETLNLERIELRAERTSLYFSITNLIEEGSFCVNKNTYLMLPSGEKIKLTAIAGIPQCPDNYSFLFKGESLKFQLDFPALKENPVCIDIIEDCQDACFSYIGVITDPELNREIEDAYNDLQNGFYEDAEIRYKSLIEKLEGKSLSIESGFYIYLIQSLKLAGKSEEALIWKEKLMTKKPPYFERALGAIVE